MFKSEVPVLASYTPKGPRMQRQPFPWRDIGRAAAKQKMALAIAFIVE